MKKRAAAIFTSVIFMLAVSGIRVLAVIRSDNAAAAYEQSSVTVTVTRPRGTIYDANMMPLTNSQKCYLAAVAPTQEAISALENRLTGIDTQLKTLRSGKPAVVEVPSDFSAEGAHVFCVNKHYSEDQTAAHIIGYLDGGGAGISGIEKAYESLLGEKEPLTVRYFVDALGRPISGIEAEINGNTEDKSAVVLTVDSRIQRICEQAAEALDTGAVVVMEADTGKIRAMCSFPDFSPLDISAAANSAGSPFINRALSGYNVGSVFKICTLSAALESGISTDMQYTCTGGIGIGSNVFGCHDRSGHGTLNMQEAFSVSCNPYFINLGQKLGGSTLYDMCLKMGFNDTITLADGISTSGISLPKKSLVCDQPATLANLSFGQGELLLTPLHIAVMTAAAVNGGYRVSPRLIEATVSADGDYSLAESGAVTRIMSQSSSDTVRDMMTAVIESGTGTAAKPSQGAAGGKTATAETGWIRDGKSVDQTWFTGFYSWDGTDYVITVLAENGESGSRTCAPVFKTIADGISKLTK
jgi:penicillin-binding protein 2